TNNQPCWACFKQLGPNSSFAERRGTSVTSDNINGTAVLEYHPTEISAPIRAFRRVPARLCRPHRQPSRAYPRETCGSLPATAAALRDSDCPLEGDEFELPVPRQTG